MQFLISHRASLENGAHCTVVDLPVSWWCKFAEDQLQAAEVLVVKNEDCRNCCVLHGVPRIQSSSHMRSKIILFCVQFIVSIFVHFHQVQFVLWHFLCFLHDCSGILCLLVNTSADD